MLHMFAICDILAMFVMFDTVTALIFSLGRLMALVLLVLFGSLMHKCDADALGSAAVHVWLRP